LLPFPTFFEISIAPDPRPPISRLTLALAVLAGVLVVAIGSYVLFFAIDASVGGHPYRAYRNVTRAMTPTLLTGERFTAVSLRGTKGELRAPSRGDLVVHRWPPDTSKLFVKRIVGVPGDTLAMVSGELLLDGQRVNEPYASHDEPGVDPGGADFDWQRPYLVGVVARDTAAYRGSRNNWGPLVLPPDKYFVLGDNRDNSLDSRYWGFLTSENIVAQPRRVYFSRDETSGAIRWGRVGTRLR
jgi:signal peptidase I